jgi:hypothetical protein
MDQKIYFGAGEIPELGVRALLAGAGVRRGTFPGRTTAAAGRLAATTLVAGAIRGTFGTGRKFGRHGQNAGRQTDFLLGRGVRLDWSLRLSLRLRRLSGLLRGLLVVGLLVRLRLVAAPLIVLIVVTGVLVAVVVTVLIIVAALAIVLAIVVAAIVIPAVVVRVAALVTALVTTVVLVGPLAVLVILLPVWLAVLLLLLKAGIQHTIIMVGMLEIVFRKHTVARRGGVARHGEEFFHELLGVAAHTAIAAAVEVRVAPAAAAAAARWARLAAVTAALTALHVVVVLLIIIHQNAWTF